MKPLPQTQQSMMRGGKSRFFTSLSALGTLMAAKESSALSASYPPARPDKPFSIWAFPSEIQKFQRLGRGATQFIAALGEPTATRGSNANEWGIWRVDPGPRGVLLRDFSRLEAAGGIARAGWQFDPTDFWVEEYGRMMEKPDFPITAGRYLVTGDREVTTILSVKADGSWELDGGATLFDVTHLPCRAARYSPVTGAGSPANAVINEFPVTPGALMPKIEGCKSMDYAVLFVIGLEK